MIEQGDTQRMRILDMALDNTAQVYYELEYPKPYHSVRYPQAHPVLVLVLDADSLQARRVAAILEES